MKCIFCDRSATYVINGLSVCDHFAHLHDAVRLTQVEVLDLIARRKYGRGRG